MTNVFAHGRLRLYLLSLLAEAPMHGYDLIQALSERFGGTYSPSAGTIYPRLAKLEEEGLVTKTADGRKTVYHITESGRRELEARSRELDEIENEMTDSVRRLADEVRAGVNQAMKSLRADLASAAREAKDYAQSAPVTSNDRVRSMTRAREVEAALNTFRQDLRTAVRSYAAHANLSDELVTQLRERLHEAHADIVALLGGPRGR